MEIRWSPEAAADFTAMIQYIQQDNSPAALRVARAILPEYCAIEGIPKSRTSGSRGGNAGVADSAASFCCGVSCWRKRSGNSKSVAWSPTLASEVNKGAHLR